LSQEENRRIYGKCNNPTGHGHNYVLEVTVAGPLDPSSGMVCDLTVLDGIVQKGVLDCFDHKNLNLDVENFRTRVPTTENVCMEIFDLLDRKVSGVGSRRAVRLARVRLEETSLNFFEYEGRQNAASRK
jgi:6-pyruvoyltetrahydropterin/6-carboxytetrahydropterin synthase